MTIDALAKSLNLTVVGRPLVGPASMTVTLSRAERGGYSKMRTFVVPYPLTDVAIGILRVALVDW